MAAWKAGGWRKASKGFAVPLTKLQIYALRVLAAQRSPDSYVAGGVALNRAGPRFSGDIDIFQDSEERLVTAAEADGAALVEAGLKLSWGRVQTGKRQAQIEGLGEAMQLEWVADSDFRFFPPNRMNCSATCCIPLTLQRTKPRRRQTGGNPATLSIL